MSKACSTVTRDGYEVPLIGIPQDATLEICDCCGDVMGLSKAVFTGRQVLCEKCSSEECMSETLHRTQWDIYESCLREGWTIAQGTLTLKRGDSVRVITPDGKSATATVEFEGNGLF